MDGLDEKFGKGRFQYLFLFDHSANHEAFAHDALRSSVVNKGWGGKQPKLRPTSFKTHCAVLPTDVCRHKKGHTMSPGSKVKVKGWWSAYSAKWRAGKIVKVNATPGEWNEGTYVVEFDSNIDQPMCFPQGSDKPVSKYGGRGSPTSTHVGCAKGAHQTLWERGCAPAVFPKRAGVTSGNKFKKAVLKYLEDEGRVGAADHDPYCHVCAVHDEETDEITCPPGDLIECTYCNYARHIDKCARLPKHVVDAYYKTGKVPGVWACPDCIQAACDGLEIESPVRPVVEVDSDVDSDPESEFDEGILYEDDNAAEAARPQTEADMDAIAGVVFGMWSITHLRMLLNVLEDFKNQQSRIAEIIQARGHLCAFLPKFYCELNWIELYWCLAKWHTRGRTNKTWKALKKAIWEAFGVVPFPNVSGKSLPTSSIVRQRESRRSREYLAAYKRGANVQTVDSIRSQIKATRRVYKQHRVPSQVGARDPTAEETRPLRKCIKRCSVCGVVGHNKRGCKRYWINRD